MNKYITRYCGTGLSAYLLNAFGISVQVLLCLVILSPFLYRFSVGKSEDWLFPWVWMTPQIIAKFALVGVVMTLCFGVGSWMIARHTPRAVNTSDKD